jgi:hypothetical protein
LQVFLRFSTPESGEARDTPRSKCELELGHRVARAAKLPRDHAIAVLPPGLGLKNVFWFVRICWY